MTSMTPLRLDDNTPVEITRRIREVAITKSQMTLTTLMTLSVLGGAFISLGALLYTQTTSGFAQLNGANMLLGGASFALGLILVVIAGAELFTGNTMMTLARVDKKITTADLARNWSLSFLGNLVGCLIVVALVYGGGLLQGNMAERAINIATAKAQLSPVEAFCRGVLCNALVCLAIWMANSARQTTGKILAIIFPIGGFVAIGLEHSIANLYLIPVGMIAGADISFLQLTNNIFWVVLGNIIGGAVCVALAYRLAFGAQRPISNRPA